jgi:large subunit ribosomal protein L18
MNSKNYIEMFRRRREGKTDYKKRKALLVSKQNFICPRISNKNITIQLISPRIEGDYIISSTHSRELLKYGWKGNRKNLSASYLTGLLGGIKTMKLGVDKAIVYLGLEKYHYGSCIAAALKGILDSGISIPVDYETLPSEENIKGEKIIKYAKLLKEKDQNIYKQYFSKMIREGLIPEEYSKHFEEVREEIIKKRGM